jgi:hypothetical protein
MDIGDLRGQAMSDLIELGFYEEIVWNKCVGEP